MDPIKKIIEVSDELDRKGGRKFSEMLDSALASLTKTGKKGYHKCGLKEESVQIHEELFKAYKKDAEELEKEYDKAMRGSQKSDSPNKGKLRDITSSYSHTCNAARLHEMYFEDVILSKPYGLDRDSKSSDLLDELYKGKQKAFLKDLKRLSKVSRNGWVLLNFCTHTKKLYLDVIDLHNENVLAMGVPVMALDMWEHAYIQDFGLDKEAYVEWFLGRLDWRNIRKRISNLMRIK